MSWSKHRRTRKRCCMRSCFPNARWPSSRTRSRRCKAGATASNQSCGTTSRSMRGTRRSTRRSSTRCAKRLRASRSRFGSSRERTRSSGSASKRRKKRWFVSRRAVARTRRAPALPPHLSEALSAPVLGAAPAAKAETRTRTLSCRRPSRRGCENGWLTKRPCWIRRSRNT